MSVYHWQEIVEPDYNYITTGREVKNFSLSYSPGQFGFPEDSFPFNRYTVPEIVYKNVELLLQKYFGDSSEIRKYLDLGIISQYLFVNKYDDKSGREIDKAKHILKKLLEYEKDSSYTSITIKEITLQVGNKSVKVDSWLFIASYLGNTIKEIDNLDIEKTLTGFSYDTYEEKLQQREKLYIYEFLVADYVAKTRKNRGKYTFISIFCHIFQIPISKETLDFCEISDDKELLDYKEGTDTIKKALKRKR